MVAQLLMDPGSSPLYVPSAHGALALQSRAALECMLGDPVPWFEAHRNGHR